MLPQTSGNVSETIVSPYWRPPRIGGDTVQGLLARTVPWPSHLVDRTLLCSLLDLLPRAPCRLRPWKTTQSPGSHDQLSNCREQDYLTFYQGGNPN